MYMPPESNSSKEFKSFRFLSKFEKLGLRQINKIIQLGYAIKINIMLSLVKIKSDNHE